MKKIAAFLCLALLSACAQEPPPRVVPQIGPASRINLDVQSVALTDRSGMQPANSPYMTNHFQPTIAESIRQWAGDHLQAVGTTGSALVIIKDATLTSQPMPHSDSWFTREQATKYTARAEVEVEIKGRADSYALASAQATRFETLPENPTDIERQNAYMTVLNGLMHDLGQSLDTSIRSHMQNFIITAPMINGQ